MSARGRRLEKACKANSLTGFRGEPFSEFHAPDNLDGAGPSGQCN